MQRGRGRGRGRGGNHNPPRHAPRVGADVQQTLINQLADIRGELDAARRTVAELRGTQRMMEGTQRLAEHTAFDLPPIDPLEIDWIGIIKVAATSALTAVVAHAAAAVVVHFVPALMPFYNWVVTGSTIAVTATGMALATRIQSTFTTVAPDLEPYEVDEMARSITSMQVDEARRSRVRAVDVVRNPAIFNIPIPVPDVVRTLLGAHYQPARMYVNTTALAELQRYYPLGSTNVPEAATVLKTLHALGTVIGRVHGDGIPYERITADTATYFAHWSAWFAQNRWDF